MTFQSIGYANQYPPFQPRSSSDVASFANLHASLRAIPELSKEGDKILNEEMLAKLVDGVMRFQRDHLGRKSKSKYWPTVRLPSPIFADRSSYPAGPLGIAILSAFRIKQISQWRNFNFDNPKLFDDNIAIIKKMEADLINRGYLRRPVIYFDASVERAVLVGGTATAGSGAGAGSNSGSTSKGGEIQRLTKIAVRFGARVVTDLKDMSDVTHIVAYDPEEHDAVEVLEEETRSSSGGGGGSSRSGRGLQKDGEDGICEEEEVWSSEKKYLKTLTVVEVPVDVNDDDEDKDDSTLSTITSGNKKLTKKMALVHWWYHPSSYDEWMPAEEVMEEGATNNFKDNGEEPHPGIPGGACVVACKFVRDVEKFNEWGVENDYAIADYERKVDYILQRNKNENVVSASISSKKTSKSKRVAAAKHEPLISEASEDVEDGHAAKKRRMDDHVVIDSPAASQSKKLKVKSSSSHSTLSSSSTIGNMNSSMYSQSRQTSERRLGTGMNPRRILTGIRGSRNEVIRRTVYDGALRVENEPYKVIKEAMADYLVGSDGRMAINGLTTPPLPALSARPEWRKLLPLTGFIRPSVHTSLKCITVTELTLADETPSEEMDTNLSVVVPTIAKNFIVPILISPELDGDGVEQSGVKGDEPLPIRGGGLEEETVDFPKQQQEGTEVYESNVVAEGDGNEVVFQPSVENSEPHLTRHGENMDVPAIDELEADTTATTNLSENLRVDLMEPAIEESASDENVQEISNEIPENVFSKEKLPERNQQKVAAAMSADIGNTPSSFEVDAPTTPSSAVVDVPAADEVSKNFDEKERDPETVKVAIVKELTVDNTPPTQDRATSYEQPPDVMPTRSASIDIQPSASAAAAVTSPVAVVTDVVSSTSVAAATNIASAINPLAVCQVTSLPPNTQLSNSLYRPTPTPNDEDSNRTLVQPPWYQATKASEFEKRTLPEWFNSTAPHRTESTFIATRETILKLSKYNAQQYITTTAIRRSVAGDAGSLLRLHKFLMDWGLLNGGQIGETAPSDVILRGIHTEGGSLERSKRKHSQMQRNSRSWTENRMHLLEMSVVKHTSKKSDESKNELKISVDWDAVAFDMGEGVTASDCQIAFINPPAEEDMFGARALASSNNWSLSQFLAGVRPEVLKAAVEGSLQFTNDLTEVRKASIVAALASTAAQMGARVESEIETALIDIVDLRLQRLENRVAILSDVEALLEAERVSLELERRDMYTTRCRHWFGDGSA